MNVNDLQRGMQDTIDALGIDLIVTTYPQMIGIVAIALAIGTILGISIGVLIGSRN